MRTLTTFALVIGLEVVSWLAAGPVAAVEYRFVSAVNGNDAGQCTATQPCRSAGFAVSVASAGDIIVLETAGNYFNPIIDKSVTIISRHAGAMMGGESGECMEITAPADAVINLDGIICAPAGLNIHGIIWGSGGKLRVRNSIIRGTAGTACGILFQPGTTAEIDIENTIVSENGASAGGGGICVLPRNGADVTGVLDRVTVQNNFHGFRTSSPAGSNTRILIRNSTFSGNGTGIRSTGPASTVRVADTSVTVNDFGLRATEGGALISVGGNVVRANGTDGAFTATEAKQ